MTIERPKIEHCGNAVYAVRTEAGPAIYPTLDDALAAIRSGSVEVSEGDSEYYAARAWLEVAPESTKPGFYGTDSGTYYVTPSGRAWVVQGDDLIEYPREIEAVPAGALPVDGLMDPDQAVDFLRAIEYWSGETLIEEA
jgi:hypothetical protein